jgi:hypothetical protein
VAVSFDGAEPTFAGFLVVPEGPAPNVDFEVPDRRVTGRVLTAEGWPAAEVLVTLESQGPPRRVLRRSTDANGAFSYYAVPPGKQILRVIAAEKRLRPDPLQFDLDGARRDVVIKLSNGQRRDVEVVDAHGDPVANAKVLCVTGAEIRATSTTDEKGVAGIDTPQDASLLYVVPKDGSFATRRLVAADPDRVRLRIPSGGAAIELVAKTVEGAAVPEVAFMMRFNGEVVPAEVVREMQVHQGARLTTDDAGLAHLPSVPPGFYEFWPFRTADEVQAILDSASEPQIAFNARVGENRVTVRFQKRQ